MQRGLCQYGDGSKRACYYAIDRNNVYRLGEIVNDADPETFEIVGERYYRDKNFCFYDDYHLGKVFKVDNCDPGTLYELTEQYAKDRNSAFFKGRYMYTKDLNSFVVKSGNINPEDIYADYIVGQMKEKLVEKISLNDKLFHDSFKGKFIVPKGNKGKYYYIHPSEMEAYAFDNEESALLLFSKIGIGIKNIDIEKILVGETSIENSSINNDCKIKDIGSKVLRDQEFLNSQSGKIFLQIENDGETWYVNPSDLKRYSIGEPENILDIVSCLSHEISDDALNEIIKINDN